MRVLDDFGFGGLDIGLTDLTSTDQVIQLGNAPLRIDIMTGVSGLKFYEAYENHVKGRYFGINTYFASIEDLLKNKRSSGRKKDLDDIDWLKKYAKSK